LPLEAYDSLGELFARRLRPGARPVEAARDAVIAPCDGTIAACGVAGSGSLIQAKGRRYQLDELVVDDRLARALVGGDYATIYLSPRDYHRVHTPVDASVVSYHYVPGARWPVNPRIAARRDRLFVRNERVVIELDGGRLGQLALVMVGAAGVGNIELCGVSASSAASWRTAGERRRIECGFAVSRGDELGAFRLGSTVILIATPGAIRLAGEPGTIVRFGQRLGTVTR
jgi:phosphatidylserine decarboxylase